MINNPIISFCLTENSIILVNMIILVNETKNEIHFKNESDKNHFVPLHYLRWLPDGR